MKTTVQLDDITYRFSARVEEASYYADISKDTETGKISMTVIEFLDDDGFVEDSPYMSKPKTFYLDSKKITKKQGWEAGAVWSVVEWVYRKNRDCSMAEVPEFLVGLKHE